MQQNSSNNSSKGRIVVNNEQKEGWIPQNNEQNNIINVMALKTRYGRVIRKPDRLMYY